MRRILLFLSSYVPLYLLLIIKNILQRCTDGGRFTFSWERLKHAHYFDEINDYAIVVLLLLCLVSVGYLKYLLNQEEGTHDYTIKSLEDQTGSMYFNYISVYLLSCLGLSLNQIEDVFVLAFLMLLIGYIYISNHLIYLNPLLQLWGFGVYEGCLESDSTGEQFEAVIIAASGLRLKTGTGVRGSAKQDFVFLTELLEK